MPGLTEEQCQLVGDLIDQVLREPSIAPYDVLEILETLIATPNLGPGDVYEALENEQSRLMYRVAGRAFLAGLVAGKRSESR